MDIQPFDCFKAKVKYHRTDDIKDGCPENGEEIIVEAAWLMEKGESFEGEFAFNPSRYIYWLPQRDLELIERVDRDIYVKERSMELLKTPKISSH